MQSRLRGLRQDRLSRRHPRQADFGRRRSRAVDECGAPGGRPWPAANRSCTRSCRRSSRGSSHARSLRSYAPTRCCLRRRSISTRPSPYFTWSIHLDGDQEMHDKSVCQPGVYERAVSALKTAKSKGFRVTINCTFFNDADPERVAAFFDDGDQARRRRHHHVARLRLRARSRPEALSQPFRHQAAVPRRIPARRRRHANGPSASRRCSWTSWPATRPTIARPGATRPAPCLAGSAPAICSARATPRPSRN